VPYCILCKMRRVTSPCYWNFLHSERTSVLQTCLRDAFSKAVRSAVLVRIGIGVRSTSSEIIVNNEMSVRSRALLRSALLRSTRRFRFNGRLECWDALPASESGSLHGHEIVRSNHESR
jgi:hypothetical protein